MARGERESIVVTSSDNVLVDGVDEMDDDANGANGAVLVSLVLLDVAVVRYSSVLLLRSSAADLKLLLILIM